MCFQASHLLIGLVKKSVKALRSILLLKAMAGQFAKDWRLLMTSGF